MWIEVIVTYEELWSENKPQSYTETHLFVRSLTNTLHVLFHQIKCVATLSKHRVIWMYVQNSP